MTKNNNGRAGQQVTDGRHRLHHDPSFFRITQGWGVFNGFFGFLAFPDFITEITDHGDLQFIIFLGQGGHHDPFHDRV